MCVCVCVCGVCVNFLQNIHVKNNFCTDQNNFTSRVWWALIEEIAPCAKEMAFEKDQRWLVVLEATRYTRIHGQQQFGKCLCVAGSQPMSEKFPL